jgi:hypothetical protein
MHTDNYRLLPIHNRRMEGGLIDLTIVGGQKTSHLIAEFRIN